MFDSIGLPELLIILVIVMLLFGVGRVEKVGKELGSTISAFRRGLREGEEDDTPAAKPDEEKKDDPDKT